MNDDDAVQQRLDRLRARHQTRAGHKGAQQPSRPGLRTLLAAETETQLPGGFRAMIHLLKNPDIRHTVRQWLDNQENHGGPTTGGENAWGLEFGVDTMPRPKELTTSSTLEDLTRYYQQLESRADWLEATLEETLLEIERVSRFKLAAGQTDEPSEALVPPTDLSP